MPEQKNIPELRFPEFDGEWKMKKLREISETITKGTTPSKFVESGNRFVKIESFNGNNIDSEKCLFISDDTHNGELKRSKLKEGDLLFAIAGATIGKCNIVPEEILPANTNQALCIIRLYPEENRWYVYYNLTSNRMVKYIKDNIAVGAQPNLNLQQIGDFPCPYPSFPEQQKIASFFTAIDQKISQLKQKKNLLEQYKKGVMQKIFSQDIRFRDDNGQEFPEWEKKRFNQVYNFRVTNSFSRENLNYEAGEVKNIHYGDIHKKFATLLDVTKEEIPYVNDDISIKKISDDNYCRTNDLVFADASEDVQDVGKCIELVNLNGERVLAGLHTILARPNNSKIANGFGGFLMACSDVRKQIMKISQGSKVTSISSTRLGDIDLIIPCQDEQSKIANFLTVIDIKINHTQTQIKRAELWKKGLLQKMFV